MVPAKLYELAKNDPGKIIEALFWIENKDAQIVPFKFNNVQRDYYSQRTSRDDILKARQQGFSSLILALFSVDFLLTPNIWCVCVSHEKEATKRLFRKVHLYLERMPFVVNLDTSRTDMITNKDNGAVFYVGTAGSRAFGQGDTVHRLHLSEFSRYQNAERVIKNVVPSVPTNGVIVKETTANGMNNMHHREWVNEKAGLSSFKPFFSPWFASREYAQQPPTPEAWTVQERELKASYGLTEAQMYWRRRKISELGSETAFQEQYPATDLEAFISSGSSAFSKDSLAWFYTNSCRSPIITGIFDESASPKFQEDKAGYLQIWEKPLPNSHYFIPADVGRSGDYCSASVMHWGRNEQVASIHGKWEPDYFARLLYKLGAWYNYATQIPERNGIGAATVATLRALDYPNIYNTSELAGSKDNSTMLTYGFDTNTRTRPLIISAGQKVVRERAVILRDVNYILEMQAFQRNADGKYEASVDEQGVAHDDRVMDFCIGQYFYQTNLMPDFAGFSLVSPMAAPDAADESQPGSMLEGGHDGFDDFT